MDKQSREAPPREPASADANPIEMSLREAYEFYAQLRKCPVRHSNALGGFYWLTRYDDTRAAALDWRRFSSARRGVALPPNNSPNGRIPALEMDPPEHGPWRRLFMESVTSEKLKAVEPKLVVIANELIDAFAGAGECDLMRDFANVMPVLAMAETIGLAKPSVARIRDLAHKFTRSVDDPKLRKSVIQEIGVLVLDEILARRAHPQEDYLTLVAQAEIDGRPMNESELTWFMIGFIVAGHESTTSSMGALFFHALSRPELKARMLADERMLAAAIEETVRLDAPFQALHRTTVEEVIVGDVAIPADSTVRLCYGAANRDPEVFERPDEFDPNRNAKPHLGFGYGSHLCPGAPLARLEMGIAFRELLRRLPDIRLMDDALDWDYVGGVFIVPRQCRAAFTPTLPPNVIEDMSRPMKQLVARAED